MPSEPRLLALKTAVPPYRLEQAEVCTVARHLFGGRNDIDRLIPIFTNTGIERRYSCVPMDWYEKPHGWTEKSALYVESAVALLSEVTTGILADAALDAGDIDALVVVSTTGIATPSLDALLVERLGLRRDIQRLPIFGLGCAGGVIGLARAAALARAAPEANVLFLVVELCALTFRKDDLSKSNIVAAALFGDGAAGALVSCQGDGVRIGAAGEYTWPQSLDMMGWEVMEDGLKARFSQSIPGLVARDFRAVALAFLSRHGLTLEDFGGFACHPGGAKVIEALEHALGLAPGALVESRAALRDYGNVSAASVLFVLTLMNPWQRTNRLLMAAMGPGFSAAFLVLEAT